MQTEPSRPEARLDGLLAALKAAGEPSRLRILALLARGELTVSELVDVLGQSQPRVSRHLKLLTDAGLITRHREGAWVFHRFADAGPGARIAAQLSGLLPAGGADDGTLMRDRERLDAVRRRRWEKAARYFQTNAEHWDRLRSLHVDDGEVETAIGRLLAGEAIGDLLDVGTGTGRILELLAPRIGRGVGIDLSREMLAVARANLERAGAANCQVRQADLRQLPFPPAGFDAVTVHQVLHFLDDPGTAVQEAAAQIRPGGRLLIVDFAPHGVESLRVDHEHRRLGFDDAEITAWVERAGLSVVTAERLAGDPLTVALWLARKPDASRRETPR